MKKDELKLLKTNDRILNRCVVIMMESWIHLLIPEAAAEFAVWSLNDYNRNVNPSSILLDLSCLTKGFCKNYRFFWLFYTS